MTVILRKIAAEPFLTLTHLQGLPKCCRPPDFRRPHLKSLLMVNYACEADSMFMPIFGSAGMCDIMLRLYLLPSCTPTVVVAVSPLFVLWSLHLIKAVGVTAEQKRM